MSGNKEGDVSLKERLRVIKAGVDTVVGAAVGVGGGVAVVITASAGITIVIQVAGGIDERRLLIVPIRIVLV